MTVAKKARVKPRKLTRDEQMNRWIEEWQRETGSEVIDPDEVASWAVRTGRFDKSPPTPTQLCRSDLQRFLRNQTYLDPQNREVRLKHPVRNEQGVLWYDIRVAKPNQMRASVQDRRRGIFADVKQCKTDVDSYNDNNRFGAQIEMDFDFNQDLEEIGKPTDYPDEKPDDDS